MAVDAPTPKEDETHDRLILGFPPSFVSWLVVGALAAAVVGVVIWQDPATPGAVSAVTSLPSRTA